MTTSRPRTRTSVWTSRRTVSSGISTVRSPFAEFSSDTPRTLPVREALHTLQRPVDAVHERFGKRLPAPHHGHQEGAGGERGGVVLAELHEPEAEGHGVAPADRPLDSAGLRQRERGAD